MMEYFAFMSDPAGWVALLTLVVLEIVLGIDNLIFISILTNKLPKERQKFARQLGIGAALVLRLALLFTISIIVQLTEPVFELFGHGYSWRDLILRAGCSSSGRRPRRSTTRSIRSTPRRQWSAAPRS